MSSTNVHSEENSNKYCASAKIIPTVPEKGLEIPPKNSKPGPTRKTVKNEELVLEISSVSEYSIKNGIVIDKASGEKLGTVSMQKCKENLELRQTLAPSKYAKLLHKQARAGRKPKEEKGMEH